MLDKRRARIACQTRLLSTVVATTGAIALSATASGYHRAAGSFLDDQFAIGMEITPSGFGANAVAVITDVTASDLTTNTTHAIEGAAGGRSLVAMLPARRAHDSLLDPVVGQSSLRSEFIAATLDRITTAQSDGLDVETGLFVVTLFTPTDLGPDVVDVTLDAVLARFASGTKLGAGAHTLSIAWSPGPRRGQLLPHPIAGLSYAQATIPWSVQSRTAVQA